MGSGAKTCAACGGQYGPEVLFCPLDGSPLSTSRSLTTAPNEIDPYLALELPGQIRINTLVGIGSMGRVYRAFQAGVDRDVAVKILHRELCGNAELVARFHREAKIASRLVHPNVVQVLMTGTLPSAGADAKTAGEVYLVMEYLDGISLLSALAAQGEGGALPLARTLHIALQLCDAVGEAHAQGIVHRDLKPENIMLVRRSEDPDFVKVLDFGIARQGSSAYVDAQGNPRELDGGTTQAGLIFGTARYISPEGAEGKHVGPQADVYSIATILYQCLAGRAPFEGESPMAVLVQQMNGTPPDLRSIPRATYVPEPIARVVMGNLVKRPEDRSDNAKVLGRELSLAARDAGIHLDSMHGGVPRGDLRLLSKQRTRQHEFTPELRAKIASMSIGDAPDSGTSPSSDGALSSPSAGAPGQRPITTYEDATLHNLPPPVAPPPPSSANGHNGAAVAVSRSRPGGTQIGPEASPEDVVMLDDDARMSAPGPSQPGSSQAGLSRPGLSQPGAGRTQLAEDTIHGSLDEPVPGSVAALRERGILEPPGPTIPGLPVEEAKSELGRLSAPDATLDPALPLASASPPAPSRPGSSPAPAASSLPSAPPAEITPPPARDPGAGSRWIALVVAALIVIPALSFAAVRLLRPHKDESAETFEADLSAANEAMNKRAWDRVKEISNRLAADNPGDPRVDSLRRTAAERIVNDALGRKYAGDPADALRLVRLALELAPDLQTAQLLEAELSRTTDATSSPSPSASASARPTKSARPGTTPSAGPSSGVAASASAKPSSGPPDGLDVPPPDLTPPPPNSSRPWL